MSFEGKSFEKPESRQDNLIKITEEEFETLRRGKEDDPDLKKLMEEKGISFDSGDIEIEVEGKKMRMTTKKEDFGTAILEEGEDIIRSGVEKKEE